MRKALIVGIDHYAYIGHLSGCVNDAHAVGAALERHASGKLNFTDPQLLLGTSEVQSVSKGELKEAARQLFADDAEIALFTSPGMALSTAREDSCARAIAKMGTTDGHFQSL